jgi:hypothetical protein
MLVLVTDQTAKQAEGWREVSTMAPLRDRTVLFWRDACRSADGADVRNLAMFLYARRPKTIIVIDSRPGREVVARFGRGLSQHAKLCCVYFNVGTDGRGAHFARLASPFAMALTDNEPTAETLRRLYGPIADKGIAVLPARVAPAPDVVFATRLAARRAHVGLAMRSHRWVWISRTERLEGTSILAALAKMRPNDRFDIFGPMTTDLRTLDLDVANVVHNGTLMDISAADFAAYDGFVFTGLSEGPPHVVLEMSQHAIPMILADAGGVLDDRAAIFVRHAGQATAFAEALDRVIGLTSDQAVEMVTAARSQVTARHAPERHARRVAELFAGS